MRMSMAAHVGVSYGSREQPFGLLAVCPWKLLSVDCSLAQRIGNLDRKNYAHKHTLDLWIKARSQSIDFGLLSDRVDG